MNTDRWPRWYWWWRWELEGLFSGIRLRRRDPELIDGKGYVGPERRLYQCCRRCGKFRVLGRFVEMQPSDFRYWWYECVDCALASMTKIVEMRAGDSGELGAPDGGNDG